VKFWKKKIYLSNTSLKGLILTIGIYSNVNDNIYSSPYAFKISMPIVQDEYQLAAQLIQIRRDQKVQCIPTEYRNKTNETIKYMSICSNFR